MYNVKATELRSHTSADAVDTSSRLLREHFIVSGCSRDFAMCKIQIRVAPEAQLEKHVFFYVRSQWRGR
jgi:hypothetical protein